MRSKKFYLTWAVKSYAKSPPTPKNQIVRPKNTNLPVISSLALKFYWCPLLDITWRIFVNFFLVAPGGKGGSGHLSGLEDLILDLLYSLQEIIGFFLRWYIFMSDRVRPLCSPCLFLHEVAGAPCDGGGEDVIVDLTKVVDAINEEGIHGVGNKHHY